MPSNSSRVRPSPFDGFSRSVALDDKITEDVSALFRTPTGRAVLDYLESITIRAVAGPAVDPNELMHREGQRFILSVISARMDAKQKKEAKHVPDAD